MEYNYDIDISSFSISRTRNRPNQDAILSPLEIDGMYVMGIADGVGGAPHGEWASRIAISTLYQHINQGLNEIKAKHVFDDAKKAITLKSKEDSSYYKTSTTLTFCTITKGKITIVYSGDTRLYVARQGKLEQITNDQTVGALLLKQHPTISTEYALHPNSKSLANAISPTIDHDAQVVEYTKQVDAIYIMSDGAYSFWEKNKKVSYKTLKNASRFSTLIKNRIIKHGPTDDASLTGVSFM